MSKDRSRTTPPSNTSPRNPTNTDRSSSRQRKHEQSPTPGERPPNSPRSSPPPIAGSSRTRPLEEDENTEYQSMAKRLRRDIDADRRSDRSSPSTDSQSGLADNEMERGQHSDEKQTSPAVAPKKKRTRTLTTPHQSAVLHSLLAQSRFPTTAMREEVGRAIGLSARKVQIWFQNQRQKARRPRTATEVVPPPSQAQYGPTHGVSDSETVNLYPRPQSHLGRPPLSSTPLAEHQIDDRRLDPAFLPQTDMTLPPLRLAGPGMPSYNSQADDLPRPIVSPIAGPSHTHVYSDRSPTPPRAYPAAAPRPYSRHHRDPSRILPPLLFPSPSRPPIPTSIRSAPATLAPPLPFHHRSLSPEVLARQSGVATTIPPPFTLQPRPQWDERMFSVPPGGPTGWRSSQTPGADSSSSAPPGVQEPTIPEEGEPYEEGNRENSPSNSRGGRYDPVRGSVVPYDVTPPHTPPNTA